MKQSACLSLPRRKTCLQTARMSEPGLDRLHHVAQHETWMLIQGRTCHALEEWPAETRFLATVVRDHSGVSGTVHHLQRRRAARHRARKASRGSLKTSQGLWN